MRFAGKQQERRSTELVRHMQDSDTLFLPGAAPEAPHKTAGWQDFLPVLQGEFPAEEDEPDHEIMFLRGKQGKFRCEG